MREKKELCSLQVFERVLKEMNAKFKKRRQVSDGAVYGDKLSDTLVAWFDSAAVIESELDVEF